LTRGRALRCRPPARPGLLDTTTTAPPGPYGQHPGLWRPSAARLRAQAARARQARRGAHARAGPDAGVPRVCWLCARGVAAAAPARGHAARVQLVPLSRALLLPAGARPRRPALCRGGCGLHHHAARRARLGGARHAVLLRRGLVQRDAAGEQRRGLPVRQRGVGVCGHDGGRPWRALGHAGVAVLQRRALLAAAADPGARACACVGRAAFARTRVVAWRRAQRWRRRRVSSCCCAAVSPGGRVPHVT
jgi:hypothetical protein